MLRRVLGASLIEVLVTVLILAFGLLGMAGLQARMQVSEFEAYQRSHAVMLASDMAARMATNRRNADAYVTGITYGSGMTCPSSATSTVERDLKEWCETLQGASEKLSAASQGSVLAGRGCIQQVGGEYMVTVAWQGRTAVAAPAASITCGAGQYDLGGSSECRNDLCRRVLTTLVRVSSLL